MQALQSLDSRRRADVTQGPDGRRCEDWILVSRQLDELRGGGVIAARADSVDDRDSFTVELGLVQCPA